MLEPDQIAFLILDISVILLASLVLLGIEFIPETIRVERMEIIAITIKISIKVKDFSIFFILIYNYTYPNS